MRMALVVFVSSCGANQSLADGRFVAGAVDVAQLVGVCVVTFCRQRIFRIFDVFAFILCSWVGYELRMFDSSLQEHLFWSCWQFEFANFECFFARDFAPKRERVPNVVFVHGRLTSDHGIDDTHEHIVFRMVC